MPNKHGHKAYHRAPQSGDRSEWSNKIIYLRNYIYIYIYQSKELSISIPNYVQDPD
jgi:hypothetical protein